MQVRYEVCIEVVVLLGGGLLGDKRGRRMVVVFDDFGFVHCVCVQQSQHYTVCNCVIVSNVPVCRENTQCKSLTKNAGTLTTAPVRTHSK